jgi:hypothetical protein
MDEPNRINSPIVLPNAPVVTLDNNSVFGKAAIRITIPHKVG